MALTILSLGASFFTEALRAAGQRVFSVGLGAEADLRVEHPLTVESLLARLQERGLVPDAAIWVDNGNLPFVVGLESLPCPSLFYSVDTFCNPWHLPFAAAFDVVFAAQKDFVPLFQREGYDCRWLPLFFTGTPPLPSDAAAFARRDVPVAFVGTLKPKNIPDRLPFLKRFRQQHPLVYLQGDYLPLFSRARIILNQTAAQELNFRCFEAMICGGALLTEQCGHGLEELFTPGVNILPTYPAGDAAKAAAIAAEWLARPDELAALALAGQKLALEQHQAVHRVPHVLACLEGLLQSQGHRQRLAEAERRRRIVATAYAVIAAELCGPEQEPLRHFFAALFADVPSA